MPKEEKRREQNWNTSKNRRGQERRLEQDPASPFGAEIETGPNIAREKDAEMRAETESRVQNRFV